MLPAYALGIGSVVEPMVTQKNHWREGLAVCECLPFGGIGMSLMDMGNFVCRLNHSWVCPAGVPSGEGWEVLCFPLPARVSDALFVSLGASPCSRCVLRGVCRYVSDETTEYVIWAVG